MRKLASVLRIEFLRYNDSTMTAAKLSPNDIAHIAKLANLILTAQEETKFASQLTAILDFVSKLQEIPTKNVIPTSQVTGLVNVFREDEVDESRILSQKEALANAPASHKGFFQVKAVFE